MTPLMTTFGYWPDRVEIGTGAIKVSTRADLEESVDRVRASSRVNNRWIYAPANERIFPMPKTHVIEHATADGPEHLEFLIWALSFFTGLRLSATEAGFIDATPIDRHVLVDFATLNSKEIERALALAEDYWQNHKDDPKAAKRWVAAVHALFLAQYPRALQYEKFMYLYAAIDACYALLKEKAPGQAPRGHPKQIPWLCDTFGIPLPAWAVHIPDVGSEVASMRSQTFHEALYLGEPLGFARHNRVSAENLPLEMCHLISRLLVALLGGTELTYVKSPVSAYMTPGLGI